MSDSNIPGQGSEPVEAPFRAEEIQEPLSPSASEFERRLSEFVTLSLRDREMLLPALVRDVTSLVTSDILNELKDSPTNPLIVQKEPVEEVGPEETLGVRDYRPNLLLAIEMVGGSPFKIESTSEVIHPWQGGFTAVVLSLGGQIMAFESNPHGKVYEQYGDDLSGYALSKAILRLHLELMGKHGGLNDDSNFKYLSQWIGLAPGKELFLGEATSLEHPYIVGASGCELTPEYINSLLPAAMRNQEHPVDFLAGYADMYFARGIINSGLWEVRDPSPVPEPPFFAELRRAH